MHPTFGSAIHCDLDATVIGGVGAMKRGIGVISLACLMGLVLVVIDFDSAFAKGGKGHGRGHAISLQGSPPGWSKGRKIGWRGLGCPPGLAKQGRC